MSKGRRLLAGLVSIVNKPPLFLAGAAVMAIICLSQPLHAERLVNVEVVRVGDPSNMHDLRGYGSVGNEYRIGKYEVTIAQYCTFLNSVAAVSTQGHITGLWDPRMAEDANVAGIARSGQGTQANPYVYTTLGSPNRPITYVSWFNAARFCNWLHNGATNGAGTETGAYTLNGVAYPTNSSVRWKESGARWWIPDENEWYKAAYYSVVGTNGFYRFYPTGSDDEPGNSNTSLTNQANFKKNGFYAVTQSTNYSSSANYLTDVGAYGYCASYYGTYDQGGNVEEWVSDIEHQENSSDWTLVVRGGSWQHSYWEPNDLHSGARNESYPFSKSPSLGFRVATTSYDYPDPSITSATWASGTVGKFFDYLIQANHSASTYGAIGLPQGLLLDPEIGAISGRPQQVGTYRVTISAENPWDSTYSSALLTLTISKGSQQISFKPASSVRYKRNGKITLAATAYPSKLPVSFKSSNPKILSISRRTATIRGKGKVTVTASQAGDANYLPAKPVKRTIMVR